ncbi:MAG: tetratricopeptide repeat protein [Syntrophaceae bacterium]
MTKPHRWAWVVIVFLLFFNAAQIEAADPDPEKQFSFAESLFEQGDFFRAITEYKRFIFFYPEDELVEDSYFRIGESYFHAGRWEETITSLDDFLNEFPESDLADAALFIRATAQKNLKRYDEALTSFDQIIKRGIEPYRDQAIYQSALVYVARNDWEKAKSVFSMMPGSSPLYPAAKTFSSGLEKINEVPSKSPVVAGTLAAVLPGSGHVYTERYRDAAIAFLLNGAFIWSAVELFRKDEYVTGGIVTFFELGWYSGNIYSAVSSAHKYNERSKGEYIKELQERSALSISYSPDFGRFLKLSFSF